LEAVQKGETNVRILLVWRRYKRRKLMRRFFRVRGGKKGETNERILLGWRRYKRGKLMIDFFWVGGGTKRGN
jgi:hypothetical protein